MKKYYKNGYPCWLFSVELTDNEKKILDRIKRKNDCNTAQAAEMLLKNLLANIDEQSNRKEALYA